jgi:predicted GTPase
VNILKRAFAALPQWPWKKNRATAEAGASDGSDHLELARESLRELINDARLPDGVRESLAHDYEAVEGMLDKLEHGHLHLAVFGRVSTGKSSLLNALIGEEAFSVSPLHGETRHSSMQPWSEVEAGGVFLIDTPGLDEAGGEDREAMAREVAGRSDLVIFVLDSDITDTAVAAQPRPQMIVEVDDSGNETEHERQREPDVGKLRLRLWDILDAEGKTLAALNASLFAADLSDQVGRRILAARRRCAECQPVCRGP